MKTIRALFCLMLSISPPAFPAGESALKSGVFDPPRAAPEFNLPASTGSEFSLASQRGKVVVLGFGFSHCPDVCPVTLATLAQMRKQLGELAEQAQVIYITVDPERDTPARLREYLALFDKSFIGLTGAPAQLKALREAYGIMAARAENKDAPDGYLVHHSTYVYLIDRAGLLRALVPFGNSAADFAHDVRILLQEPDGK
ncbi:MAG TPA: SCO family protein [Gammaproteobacteria bacterium]|nr:SCO family protein [Gammaproteobacteria bacterium]